MTPDGYSVNTTQPPYQPSGVVPAPGGEPRLRRSHGQRTLQGAAAAAERDRRSATRSRRRTSAGPGTAAAGISRSQDGRRPPEEKRNVIYTREDGSPNFQPHHQPFNYYARFAPGTADRAKHLKDGEDFLRDIDTGNLPQVAFYKPVGILTQHPSYTDLISGDEHVDDLLKRLRRSPQWAENARCRHV